MNSVLANDSIASGEKPSTPNTDINTLDTIVSKIKHRAEVTTKYMQQWDRERIMKREWTEEVTSSNALSAIIFNRNHSISDEETRAYLINELGIPELKIDALFEKADEKMALTK